MRPRVGPGRLNSRAERLSVEIVTLRDRLRESSSGDAFRHGHVSARDQAAPRALTRGTGARRGHRQAAGTPAAAMHGDSPCDASVLARRVLCDQAGTRAYKSAALQTSRTAQTSIGRQKNGQASRACTCEARPTCCGDAAGGGFAGVMERGRRASHRFERLHARCGRPDFSEFPPASMGVPFRLEEAVGPAAMSDWALSAFTFRGARPPRHAAKPPGVTSTERGNIFGSARRPRPGLAARSATPAVLRHRRPARGKAHAERRPRPAHHAGIVIDADDSFCVRVCRNHAA
jgi:hypothetical protein